MLIKYRDMEISQPGSHIDHLLRQTRMNNLQLSAMADVKANLLLTIASVVLGIALSQLSQSPRDYVFISLAAGSVLTIAMAIYATMPKAGPMSFFSKRPDVNHPNFTLLFFGDYARLSYGEFEKNMENALNNPSLAYEVQIKELYNVGVYLARHKYKKLRLAYLFFLTGVIFAAGFSCYALLI